MVTAPARELSERLCQALAVKILSRSVKLARLRGNSRSGSFNKGRNWYSDSQRRLFQKILNLTFGETRVFSWSKLVYCLWGELSQPVRPIEGLTHLFLVLYFISSESRQRLSHLSHWRSLLLDLVKWCSFWVTSQFVFSQTAQKSSIFCN